MDIFLKRFTFSVLLSLLTILSSVVFAAPYFNQPHEFTQPDGTPLTLILNGDEFYMRAETRDGYTVVRDSQTGWICYAELSADGTELISTGVPVQQQTAQAMTAQAANGNTRQIAGKTIKKEIRIKNNARLTQIKQRQKLLFGEDVEVINGLPYPLVTGEEPAASASVSSPLDTAPAAQPAPGTLPPTKNISNFSRTMKGLVLVFDFSDAPASHTMQEYYDKVNKPNAHYANGNASSLRTFYEDVSRGVFIMDHFVYGIFRAPQTFAYYDSLNYTEGARQLLSYGLNQMEADGFDFSQLTTNASGEIQALALMYTGSPAAWAEGMWYHAGGWGGFSADGVHTGPYCTDNAGLDPGTLIHEHGHMAAKWPDTYSYVNGEPGTWGVMGGGYCDLPNPYFLYENGWLDAENIMDIPGLYSMNSSDPHFAYFYYDPDQPTEFFMIRPYVNSLMYCPSIPDQGLTFWRIYTDGDNAQYPNTDRHIELVHANNTDTNKTSNVCFKENGLLDHFDAFTTPSSNWKFGAKAGQQSGLQTAAISAPGAQMTFVLGTPPESIPYYPLNGNLNDASGSGYAATGSNFTGTPWSTDTFDGSYFDLGQSLRFDGADDYIECPAAVSANNALTIAFWVKPDKVDMMVPLDKFPADSTGAGWSIRLMPDGRLSFLIGSQYNYTQTDTFAPVYEAGRWVHIACTYADGTSEIYINGIKRMIKHGISQTPNTTSTHVRMGIASQVNTEAAYQGRLDDVRFYDISMGSGPLNAIDGLNVRPDKGPLALLSLDEPGGAVAHDSSGQGYDGTLFNDLSFDTDSVNGPVGNALAFDGVDDYIELPAGLSQRNGGFTVALWAYPTAVKNWSRFIDFGNGSSSNNILLARQSTSNDLVFEAYNGSASGGKVTASGAIALNQWQFFAASVDTAGQVKIYKNGQVIKTGTTAVPLNVYRRNLYIGRSNWSSDAYYKGGMDDIRIYNYQLSDAEIMDIYHNNRMEAPVPFSGATDVSPQVIPTFTANPQALRHDLYFGTEYNAVLNADPQSPEYLGRRQTTAFNPPALEGWRDYFWRVDELLPDGTVQTGPVWRFTTGGGVERLVWTGLSSANELSSLTSSPDYPNNPTLITHLDTFEIPTNWDDNYGTRVHGLLVPQTSGSYRFWISGDNEVALWLSTDATPNHATRIAYIQGTWSDPLNFDQHASQRSALITLQANQPYFIAALHKEGDGGDHMAVAWQGPDSPTRSIIDGFWLRPLNGNEWPSFETPALPTVNAVEGIALSAPLPATAVDTDNNAFSYTKLTGPSWLHVSANGDLSGTPANGDAGMNTFTIRAGDGKGGYGDASLFINVANRFTGAMGLDDLFGFAQDWMSGNPDSPANLDAVQPVNNADLSQLANAWQTGIVDGLVAHWTLDDTVGLFARDNYAQHDGTLVNMSEYHWTPGILNNALTFDGVDDYVDISGFKGVTGTAARTCMAWIKTSAAPGMILSWGEDQDGQKWTLRVESDGTLGVGIWGGSIHTTTPVNDGQWHHVAAVLIDDGDPVISEIRLYIDGNLQTTSVSSTQAIDTGIGQNVMIGTFENAGSLGVWFAGKIDDVYLYNRALSTAEIAGAALRHVQLSLPLDETAGFIARDRSPYNRSGMLYNGPTWQPGTGSGGSLAFDGVDDYAAIPGYKGITGTAARTCMAWIKTAAAPGIILSWGDEQAGQKWAFRIETDGTLGVGIWGGYIHTTAAVNDNQWHHVAAVLPDDGNPNVSEIQLYIDGVPQTTSTSSTQPIDTGIGHQDVLIGTLENAGTLGSWFSGSIDSVRLYDTALNDQEIQQIAGE